MNNIFFNFNTVQKIKKIISFFVKYADLAQDGDDLQKTLPPFSVGIKHPTKPWVSKMHPNGTIMWHASPELAKYIDNKISNMDAHSKIANSLPEPHKIAYLQMVQQVIKDPTRHFIPTEEKGIQKIRARHLNSLIDGASYVKLDYSHPNKLLFIRNSHSQEDNKGVRVVIEIPVRRPA